MDKNIRVEFLGKNIDFKNETELKNHLKDALKVFNKNSSEYAQLRMIQLKYGL